MVPDPQPRPVRTRAASARGSTFVALLAIASIAGALLWGGWGNWPAADDFCNRVLVSNLGVLGALDWLYTQWSGRLFTGLLLYATVDIVDVPALRMVSMVMAAAVVFAAWQMAGFIAGRERPVRLPLVALVLAALAAGLYPLLAQAVYWPTGGIVYWVPLLLLLHWLRGMQRLLLGQGSSRDAYWVLVSVLLGDAIELVVPVAVCYAVLVAAARWARLGTSARRSFTLRMVGLAIGVAVLMAAPGNYLRGNATAGSFNANPAFLAKAYVAMLHDAVLPGAAMLGIVGALLALALLLRIARGRGVDAQHGAAGLEAVALFAGALSSLVPVLAAPAQFAPRNALYLLVIGLLAALRLAVPRAGGDPRPARAADIVMASASLIAAAVLAGRLGQDGIEAQLRRHEQVARDRTLRSASRALDVSVAPITAPAPPIVHAIDITPDPRALVNWCVATYYGVHSVRVDPAAHP